MFTALQAVCLRLPPRRDFREGLGTSQRSTLQTYMDGRSYGVKPMVKKTILVVEDDECERLLYHEVLTDEGYDVMLAKNGKGAVKKVEQKDPDLVVLDIVMPEMDGLEALPRILHKHKNMPVILNTGYTEYMENFITWAADAYVVKSSDLSELTEKIEDLLSGKFPDGEADELDAIDQNILRILGDYEEVRPLDLWYELGEDDITKEAVTQEEMRSRLEWLTIRGFVEKVTKSGQLTYHQKRFDFAEKNSPKPSHASHWKDA